MTHQDALSDQIHVPSFNYDYVLQHYTTSTQELHAHNVNVSVANFALQLRHNEHDGIPHHQPYDCLLNRLFRRGSKKTSKLCVTGLCEGNSSGTGDVGTNFIVDPTEARDVSGHRIWYDSVHGWKDGQKHKIKLSSHPRRKLAWIFGLKKIKLLRQCIFYRLGSAFLWSIVLLVDI